MSHSKYKILFVMTPALHPNAGGVQMSTCKLGRHFHSLGHEVAVFSFADRGHVDSEPMQLVHATEPGCHRNNTNLHKLGDTIRRIEPDVVINQMPYEHVIGRVLKNHKHYLLLGCLRNTLYSVRGNLDAYIDGLLPARLASYCRNPVGRWIVLLAHRCRHRADLLQILGTYDHFVMFGPPNLDELGYFVPKFSRDRVRLIPNSIPQVAKVPPPKEKRLLWLGRVEHKQKRAELILPVWQQVCEQLTDWELDVVGDGPELETIRDQAKQQGLPRIHFFGRQVPDEYYQRAAIFFMTSSFEGFPNTLVEAQSYGAIPVVFDSYPVASWIVDEGSSGYLVKAFDVEAMANRIVEVACHPDQHHLAQQVLESARRFQIDRVGVLWQELFDAEVPRHLSQQPATTQRIA